ncbi:MAG: Fe-S cluster assembly protein SufD [Acidobacteria bacterium]|nr:Fe-S cluster assembly protein SufD [Acidobacteriota bacterium]
MSVTSTSTPVSEQTAAYAERFAAFRATPAFGSDRLRTLRDQAFGAFMATGFPTSRSEEYKFTNVGPIAEAPFGAEGAAEPTRKALEPFLFDGAIRTQIVIVNGRLSKTLSSMEALPRGVTVDQVSDAIIAAPSATPAALASAPFVALNTAFFERPVVLMVPHHAVVDEPIQVLFVNTPGSHRMMASTRLLVVAGEQSQLTLIETYAGLPGSGQGFTNAVTDFVVSEGAVVDHYKLQRETTSAYHMASMFVHCGRSSNFSSHSFATGGKIVRNDVFATLDGEGAECTLNGLYLAGGDTLIDNHTSIDHAKAHCPSHEIYKGILSGHAKAVFNGKIVVRQDAQKTDAKQTNKALLLSDDASINTKPQLEIFADDVKCTHGAAIGQLDDDAMFYLRARGIAEPDARNMLIHAFAGDILNRIKIDAVKARVEKSVFAVLETL